MYNQLTSKAHHVQRPQVSSRAPPGFMKHCVLQSKVLAGTDCCDPQAQLGHTKWGLLGKKEQPALHGREGKDIWSINFLGAD